tara:strand:+ start:3005 stop:3211 length:207 start_codon:yes stop_codon:yes gene_type:complete
MLRGKAIVSPKSDKAKQIYADYLNNKPLVYIEHKRENRWFFSAIDNPDFWFWVDVPTDINWDYTEVKQ